jgi:hypothetical protein
VSGDIADGDHCSSCLRVSAGLQEPMRRQVTQTVYVNGFVACRINSKGYVRDRVAFRKRALGPTGGARNDRTGRFWRGFTGTHAGSGRLTTCSGLVRVCPGLVKPRVIRRAGLFIGVSWDSGEELSIL